MSYFSELVEYKNDVKDVSTVDKENSMNLVKEESYIDSENILNMEKQENYDANKINEEVFRIVGRYSRNKEVSIGGKRNLNDFQRILRNNDVKIRASDSFEAKKQFIINVENEAKLIANDEESKILGLKSDTKENLLQINLKLRGSETTGEIFVKTLESFKALNNKIEKDVQSTKNYLNEKELKSMTDMIKVVMKDFNQSEEKMKEYVSQKSSVGEVIGSVIVDSAKFASNIKTQEVDNKIIEMKKILETKINEIDITEKQSNTENIKLINSAQNDINNTKKYLEDELSKLKNDSEFKNFFSEWNNLYKEEIIKNTKDIGKQNDIFKSLFSRQTSIENNFDLIETNIDQINKLAVSKSEFDQSQKAYQDLVRNTSLNLSKLQDQIDNITKNMITSDNRLDTDTLMTEAQKQDQKEEIKINVAEAIKTLKHESDVVDAFAKILNFGKRIGILKDTTVILNKFRASSEYLSSALGLNGAITIRDLATATSTLASLAFGAGVFIKNLIPAKDNKKHPPTAKIEKKRKYDLDEKSHPMKKKKKR